jgi:predicted HTH domain antitoxin
MTTTQVTIDVPADEGSSKEELAREVRLVWILDLVRRGRISVGKGAELVGLDRWQFTEVMAEHGVPMLAYPASDLDRELAALER